MVKPAPRKGLAGVGGMMSYLSALQGLSLKQIQSVIEIMQQSSEAYMFILDLTVDTYTTLWGISWGS